jgi:uncharacterized RDD family membrane protein YckC
VSDLNTFVTGDDLVTGEAVALELPAATVGLRAASGLIDVVIELILLASLLLVSFTAVSTSDDAVAAVAVLLCTVGVLVGLPTALETITRGKTIGKLALGLRAVRDDAGPITFRQSLVRALVGFVEIWIFYGVPALLCALVSSRGKRLGDMVAGTYVVRDRFSFPPMQPVMMPPQLAHWAATADIAPLPDTLALATRQFLMRAPSLNPASRASLGHQLVTQVLAQVAPQPPVGHHPETVLAAVLAERRRRDEERLARDARLRARLRRAP